jgi:hypothetical protein
MSGPRLSGAVEDEFKISFLSCEISRHFTSLGECFDHLHSMYKPIGDQPGQPSFLFRGEPGIYDTTHSRRARIEMNLWGRLEKSRAKLTDLVTYCQEKLGRLIPSFSPEEITAFLQHYGLPTYGLDLTADLLTAAYFGSFGDTNRIKLIAAINTGKLLKAREALIALNSDGFGSRPIKQKAYVTCLASHDNLKAPEITHLFDVTWYSFILTAEDKYKFNSARASLSEGDSSHMGIVTSLIGEYESLHSRMPLKIRKLYTDNIAKNMFSVQ